MPPPDEDDWSDSDDDAPSEIETSVLLGVPDGSIENTSDLADAAVSRIGGHPAFLPSPEPPSTSAECTICSNAMELLVQMWCPFEDSPFDRALYVWGCARSGCQNKPGSVRAWRGLRYNEKFAEKLKEKLAKRKEKQALLAQKKTSTNPFSLGSTGAAPAFGLGSQLFGSAPVAPEVEKEEDIDDNASISSSSSSEKSLLTAMASTKLEESQWKDAPAYPPLYLSTVSEYLPPQSKPKLPAGISDGLDDAPAPKSGKDISWAFEPYENSLEVDYAFERFAKRVSYEGEQCVRYELKGVPLPYCSDKTFDMLFPAPPAPNLPVTKAAFTVVPAAAKRTFDARKIPRCPHCNSLRTFECQLMPNLANVLRVKEEGTTKFESDEERRKAIEQAIKGTGNKNAKTGLDWGTCMVFSCEKDCAKAEDGQTDLKNVWREEVVLVQYDT